VFYCSTEHQKEDWKQHKELCKTLQSLRKTKEGYHKEIITEAANTKLKPARGAKVLLHFAASLPNGTVFEDSRAANKPLEIVLGRKTLIRGLEEGVMTMSKGERAKLVILPHYAYDDSKWQSYAPPAIPTHLPVIFDVTLESIA